MVQQDVKTIPKNFKVRKDVQSMLCRSTSGEQFTSIGAGNLGYWLVDESATTRLYTPFAYGFEAIGAADTDCASECNVPHLSILSGVLEKRRI
ncbi:hypothetical protein ACFOQM_11965 [Paenibacillus sp. GCM10012307]|uniref:hypothetical protein n=1 Tax=Paenibacillus sp. GCM10012307 TaxID=3317343 RepID=UPI00361B3885